LGHDGFLIDRTAAPVWENLPDLPFAAVATVDYLAWQPAGVGAATARKPLPDIALWCDVVKTEL
jgi:hypothetical protein